MCILCKLGFHKWIMTKKYIVLKCEKCGTEKGEYYI